MNEPTEPTKEFFKMVFENQDDKGNQMHKTVTFKKFDDEKQITYGVVYGPMKVDSQGDFMVGDEVEKMAHQFTADGLSKNIDKDHNGIMTGSAVVESFIAKADDPDFDTGDWVLGVQHPDYIWALIKSRDIIGQSLQGLGSRHPTVLKGQKVYELRDMNVTNVSLTGKPANRTEFAIKKSGNKEYDDAVKQLEQVYAALDKTAQDTPTLSKEQQDDLYKRKSRSDYLTLFIKHCNDQLFGMYENPMPGWERREERLQERIDEAKCERFALGINDDGDFEKHSAFGGTSVIAPITDPSLSHDTMGTTGNYSNVVKDDKPIDCNTMGISENRYANLDSVDLNGMKF